MEQPGNADLEQAAAAARDGEDPAEGVPAAAPASSSSEASIDSDDCISSADVECGRLDSLRPQPDQALLLASPSRAASLQQQLSQQPSASGQPLLQRQASAATSHDAPAVPVRLSVALCLLCITVPSTPATHQQGQPPIHIKTACWPRHPSRSCRAQAGNTLSKCRPRRRWRGARRRRRPSGGWTRASWSAAALWPRPRAAAWPRCPAWAAPRSSSCTSCSPCPRCACRQPPLAASSTRCRRAARDPLPPISADAACSSSF